MHHGHWRIADDRVETGARDAGVVRAVRRDPALRGRRPTDRRPRVPLDDGWVNYIGHTLDEIEVRDGRLRCELLNRHDTHTQTLMPMSGDALVVVAPAGVDFSRARRTSTRVKAFALPAAHVRAPAPRHVALGPVPRGRRRVAHLQHPGRADGRRTTASWSSRATTASSTKSSPEPLTAGIPGKPARRSRIHAPGFDELGGETGAVAEGVARAACDQDPPRT